MATPTTLPASFTAGQVLTAAQMNDLRGAFRVLQVVSTNKTDTFSTTSTSFADITGLSVAITPSSTSSQIFVIATIQVGSSGAGPITGINLVRGSTSIGQGAAAGSRTRGVGAIRLDNQATMATIGVTFLDSPATTSATTYKLQMQTSSGTSYVNRSSEDQDATGFLRTSSTITVMEISA